MPLIRITGPALADPGQRIASERLLDCIGYCFEANGRAVAAICEQVPPLPMPEGVYAVAIADVLEALALNANSHPDAIIAWGALIESCLVYFPADSVEIDTK